MRLRWLVSARESLRQQLAFIAQDNPAAASRLRVRIHAAVSQLSRFPECGRAGSVEGTRELIVAGLPFVVMYHVREDTIFVLRIFHTASNWQGTTQ